MHGGLERVGVEHVEAFAQVNALAEGARLGRDLTRQERATADRAWRRRLADRDLVAWLYVEDGVPCGTVCVMPAREDGGAGAAIPGLAHLSGVAVLPDRWRRGIGGALVAEATREAAARGYARVQLYTHETNERARRLYERLGWTLMPERETGGTGEALVRYELAPSTGSPRG